MDMIIGGIIGGIVIVCVIGVIGILLSLYIKNQVEHKFDIINVKRLAGNSTDDDIRWMIWWVKHFPLLSDKCKTILTHSQENLIPPEIKKKVRQKIAESLRDGHDAIEAIERKQSKQSNHKILDPDGLREDLKYGTNKVTNLTKA